MGDHPGPDAGGTGGRHESALQRSDRQFGELLQELRVILPGVQVLFAFLLTVPFSARFDETTDLQQWLYFVTLLSTTVATVLLMAPTALHRLRFRRGMKGDIVDISHQLTLGGLAALAVAIVVAITLVTDVLFATWAALLVGGAVLVLVAALWCLLPLSRRAPRPPGS